MKDSLTQLSLSQVKVSTGASWEVGRLATLFAQELRKEQDLPVYTLRLGGSFVLSLVCKEVSPRDIDLKMGIVLSSPQDHCILFTKVRQVWERVIGVLPKQALSPTFTRDGKESFTNLHFPPAQRGALPLDFSLRIRSCPSIPDHVTNADALYLDVEEWLDDRATLHLGEGDLSLIEQRVLCSQMADKVQGGWGRYLLYITNGWTAQTSLLSDNLFCHDTLANVSRLLKKRRESPLYAFLFWSNALLHNPQDETIYSIWHSQNPWPSLSGDREAIFFQLFLEAESVKEVAHRGGRCLQCFLREGYVLLPLPLVRTERSLWDSMQGSSDKFLYLSGDDKNTLRMEAKQRWQEGETLPPFSVLLVEEREIQHEIYRAWQQKDRGRGQALLLFSPYLASHEVELLVREADVATLTEEEKERIPLTFLVESLYQDPAAAPSQGFPLTSLLLQLSSSTPHKAKVILPLLQRVIDLKGGELEKAPSSFFEDLKILTKSFATRPRQKLFAQLVPYLTSLDETTLLDFLRYLGKPLQGEVGQDPLLRTLDAFLREDISLLADLLQDSEKLEIVLPSQESVCLNKAFLLLAERGQIDKVLPYEPSFSLCPSLYAKSRRKEPVVAYVRDRLGSLSFSECLAVYGFFQGEEELLLLVEEMLVEKQERGYKPQPSEAKFLLRKAKELVGKKKESLMLALLRPLPFSDEVAECLLSLDRHYGPFMSIEHLLPTFRYALARKKEQEAIALASCSPLIFAEGYKEFCARKEKIMAGGKGELVAASYVENLSEEERFSLALSCLSSPSLSSLFHLALPEVFLLEKTSWTPSMILQWLRLFERGEKKISEESLIFFCDQLPLNKKMDQELCSKMLSCLAPFLVHSQAIVTRFFPLLSLHRASGFSMSSLQSLHRYLQDYLDVGFCKGIRELLDLRLQPPLDFSRFFTAYLPQEGAEEEILVRICERQPPLSVQWLNALLARPMSLRELMPSIKSLTLCSSSSFRPTKKDRAEIDVVIEALVDRLLHSDDRDCLRGMIYKDLVPFLDHYFADERFLQTIERFFPLFQVGADESIFTKEDMEFIVLYLDRYLSYRKHFPDRNHPLFAALLAFAHQAKNQTNQEEAQHQIFAFLGYSAKLLSSSEKKGEEGASLLALTALSLCARIDGPELLKKEKELIVLLREAGKIEKINKEMSSCLFDGLLLLFCATTKNIGIARKNYREIQDFIISKTYENYPLWQGDNFLKRKSFRGLFIHLVLQAHERKEGRFLHDPIPLVRQLFILSPDSAVYEIFAVLDDCIPLPHRDWPCVRRLLEDFFMCCQLCIRSLPFSPEKNDEIEEQFFQNGIIFMARAELPENLRGRYLLVPSVINLR